MGFYEKRGDKYVKVAGGMALDKEPDYELIYDATLEEDTAQILLTKEADGTPYSFKKIKIGIYAVAGEKESAIFNIYFDKDATYRITVSGGAHTEDRYSTVYAEIKNGQAEGMSCIAAVRANDILNAYLPPHRFFGTYMEKFDTLRIDVGGGVLVAGSKIQIYGVRA